MISERTAWWSVIAIVFAVLAMAAYTLVDQGRCKQTALAQNYPAESIKKICR